jgi:hypothetical protein
VTQGLGLEWQRSACQNATRATLLGLCLSFEEDGNPTSSVVWYHGTYALALK